MFWSPSCADKTLEAELRDAGPLAHAVVAAFITPHPTDTTAAKRPRAQKLPPQQHITTAWARSLHGKKTRRAALEEASGKASDMRLHVTRCGLAS